MSKSKGNVVDPWAMMDKWGADAIRWYFFTVNQPGEPKRFDEKALEEITKKVFLILWNVVTFYKMFEAESRKQKAESIFDPKHVLDQWLMAELDALTKDITADLEAYHVVDACRRINGFVNDLSTWYVRRSRDRFKGGDSEAVATLGHALLTLSKLMAPFSPFLAEALYREVGGEMESVHLDRWPEHTEASSGEEIRTLMMSVRMTASIGQQKRDDAKIPLRQALSKAYIGGFIGQMEGREWMKDLLKEELNVLSVERKNDLRIHEVELDTEITPELRRLGLLREIVRNVNALRKEAGLTPTDRVILNWEAGGELWAGTFEEHGEALMASVHADSLKQGRIETAYSGEIEADGEKLWFGFNR